MSDNPIMTIAGIMPGGPEMTSWKTAMHTPDADLRFRRTVSRGPSISIAGVMPGAPTVPHWNTPYPNGESIYVAALRRAEAKAALDKRLVELPRRTSRRRALGGEAKAA